MVVMDIETVIEPPRLVAVVRRTVPMAELKGFYDSVYGEVIDALGTAGHVPRGPALGWLHHHGTFEELDIAAGFPVEGIEVGPLTPGVELTREVEVVEIPGGRALVAEHVGPYDGLPDAWQALESHREAAGLTSRGDTVEEYLTEPTPDGDPALNRSRLVMMVH